MTSTKQEVQSVVLFMIDKPACFDVANNFVLFVCAIA
jgi:hypothetical protein